MGNINSTVKRQHQRALTYLIWMKFSDNLDDIECFHFWLRFWLRLSASFDDKAYTFYDCGHRLYETALFCRCYTQLNSFYTYNRELPPAKPEILFRRFKYLIRDFHDRSVLDPTVETANYTVAWWLHIIDELKTGLNSADTDAHFYNCFFVVGIKESPNKYSLINWLTKPYKDHIKHFLLLFLFHARLFF